MTKQMCEITFEPDGIKIKVPCGVSILEAAQRAGIILGSVCGGAGTCKKCQVDISGGPRTVDGQAQPQQSEGASKAESLDKSMPDKVLRVLACQYVLQSDLIVTIPEGSRFFEQKILEEGIASEARIDPVICKHYLELTEPRLDDLRSDASRLTDAVQCGKSHTCRDHADTASQGTTVNWSPLQQLPQLLRDNNYAVTALCHRGCLFALEAGDTTGTLFGLAVDIGTTTVVASLVNLIDGKVVAVASETNPQVAFGDDVISRIEYSRGHSDQLQQLHHRIIECLNRLIGQLCKKSLVNPWQIYEMTAAGNATMQHLLLAIPVEQIGRAPYVSAFSAAQNIPAAALALDIHPEGNVYVLPSVAAHVGGDTVAVALSAAMRHSDGMNLAMDIGTNGEVILGNRERLLVCSTAAGPAFEGARIKQGMRAAAGAIEQVRMDEDVDISVIGGVEPIGICGSGLIDAIAELLHAGLLDSSGRLLSEKELGKAVPGPLRRRLIADGQGASFVLAPAKETRHDQAITLTQRDIREAQLGKAALSAGVKMLLKTLQIEPNQIDRLYLAGAFGNYIRPQSAQRLGLLPDVPLEKIQFIGNAASTGAKEVLLSREARRHAEQLGREIEYVELAGRSDFQEVFSDSMFFGPW